MKYLGIAIAVLAVLLIAVILFYSCSGETPQSEEPAPPTEEIAAELAPTATATQPPATIAVPPATATNAPTADAPPAAEPVIAKALVILNLRQGPDTGYGTVGSIPTEDEVVVVGRNADSSWLLVNSSAGQAWMIGGAEFVSVDAAAVAALPVVEAAPPYDANHPRVRQVLEEIPLVVLHGGSHTCASRGGLNHLLDSVAAGNVIGPHSGDFVYGQDNVLFEYSGDAIRMIKENPIARFENDEKYLSFTQAMQLFQAEAIIWTGSIGEWPARGVPGCDLSARP